MKLSAKRTQKIVNDYLCGVEVKKLCKEYNLSKSSVYNYIHKYSTAQCTPINLKEHKLLKQKAQTEATIIKILKEAPCLSTDSLKERLNAIDVMSNTYTVNALCNALNVTKGTYYNHKLRNKNGNDIYHQKRKELTPIIEEIYNKNYQTLGAGKMTAILKDRGYKVSERLVGQIMHQNGWFSIGTNAKVLYERECIIKENKLKQDFNVDKPNSVWVSDITYFRYNNRTYYICAILDLFSRKVVAYKISKRNSTQLTKSTLQLAVKLRSPYTDLTFHSDNGSNYTSKRFCGYLKFLKIKQSFSRVMSPRDNAVCESFFAILKKESLYRYKYSSEKQLYLSIEEYMNYYNKERPHTTLNYFSPNRYEEKYGNI